MKYKELVKFAETYRPAFTLDSWMSPSVRRIVRKSSIYLDLILALLFLSQTGSAQSLAKTKGAFFIVLFVSIVMCLLEAFYHSTIFRLSTKIIKQKGDVSFFPVTYDTSSIIFKTPQDDILFGFINSTLVRIALSRLNIPTADINNFIANRKEKLTENTFEITPSGDMVTFSDYSKAVFKSSKEFSQFLFNYQVTEDMWSGIVSWISRMRYREMREKRFWSRESLGRMPSLGKEWSYGKAWTLTKYATVVQNESFAGDIDESLFVFYEKEFADLETVLVKKSGANAIIVSDDPQSASELVAMLGIAIDRGYAYPEIEEKKVFYLRSTKLLNGITGKDGFESVLNKILGEARDVGNVILAIENFALLVDTAKTYQSDIVSIFNIFFNSPDLHVIALVDKNKYHNSIETNRSLLSEFEKVDLKEKDSSAVLRALEDEILSIEARNRIFVTYPALHAIVEGVERYFSDTFMYDKARDVLTELVPFIKHQKRNFIVKEDVSAFFADKTGVSQGEIKTDERDKLIHLEDTLHKRVIGQDEAIVAISNALRRSRAGVGSTKRPIGSFLFLGPTGVGKTETTKALSQTFFGNEDSIIRFDMSEYKSDDSLKRLIGSFEENKSGLLSKRLRDNPYSVLLLDEFEKTNKDVHDLFLQIIDEGFFSDMDGNKVNVRNTIIIATSNAGSDLIFDYAKKGAKLSEKKDEIISAIISQGIFKPELINRFDGTILFQPLAEDDLKKIAKLMLVKLEDRLKEKGIGINITDRVIADVAHQGMDTAFGARPMNRYIQEKIEASIADKIIRGEIKQGETVDLDGVI